MTRKLLLLHGYLQNEETFKNKTGGLRKALKKLGFSLHYVRGPYEAKEIPGGAEVPEGADARSWWESRAYDNCDKSLQYLKEYANREGPFAGVLGFSQGAALAAYLLSDWSRIMVCPEPRFLILFSGFKLSSVTRIEVPTLNIWGTFDTVVSEERSMELAHCCTVNQILTHPGGHYVPNTSHFVANIAAWIDAVFNPKTSVTIEEEGEESDPFTQFD